MSKIFHHVGIIVKDLEEAAKYYNEMLGMTPIKNPIEDSTNGVRALSLTTGSTIIELIQPTRENRFNNFLNEKGESLFNICYYTEEFDKEVDIWKEKGYVVDVQVALSDPDFPFRQAWVSPISCHGIWIELVDMAAKRIL